MAKFLLGAILLSLSLSVVQGITAAVLVLYSSSFDEVTVAGLNTELSNSNATLPVDLRLILRDLNVSSCRDMEIHAVSTFIQYVIMNTNDVIATIGPSCTDAAYAISSLTSRREVSMVHLHTSPLPATLVANLNSSYGLLGPIELLADASIELILRSNWSQVMALYQDTNTEMNAMFNYIQGQLGSEDSNKTLGYSSIVQKGHIHLDFALSHVAIRIIFLMSDKYLARKVLCEAYYLQAVYPDYQWVIFRATQDEIISAESDYMCKREELLVVLEQAIFLGYEDYSSQRSSATNVYTETLKLLHQGIRLSKSSNMSLSKAICHLKDSISIPVFIQQHQNDTGVSAVYHEMGPSLTVQGAELNIVPSAFAKVSDTVNIHVFYFTLAIIALQTLVTITMQVLTIYYRKNKAIRSTSLNLQQLAYLGTYMIIFSTFIYTLQKSVMINDKIYVHLCGVYNFTSNFAYTLLVGTLTVKVWRLYRIFNNYMDPGNLLSDKKLTLIVISLTLVDVIICIMWEVIGNPVRTEIPLRIDFEKRVEIIQNVCRTKYFFVWMASITVYHLILLLTAAVLSVRVKIIAPKYQKEFRRNEVILLTYIIVTTTLIGYPTYHLAQYITGYLLFEYIVAFSVLSCYTNSYLVLFFASPLLRAIREEKKSCKPQSLCQCI